MDASIVLKNVSLAFDDKVVKSLRIKRSSGAESRRQLRGAIGSDLQ